MADTSKIFMDGIEIGESQWISEDRYNGIMARIMPGRIIIGESNPAAERCLKVGDVVELAGVQFEVDCLFSLGVKYPDVEVPEAVYGLWDGSQKGAILLFPKASNFYCCEFPDFLTLEDLTEAVEMVRGLLEGKKEEPEPKIKLEVGQVWHNTLADLYYEILDVGDISICFRYGSFFGKYTSNTIWRKKTFITGFNNGDFTLYQSKPKPKPKPTQNQPVTPETFQPIYKKRVVCSPDCPVCGGSGWINQYPLLAPDSAKRCRNSKLVMKMENIRECNETAFKLRGDYDAMLDFYDTFPMELEVTE